MAMSLFGRTRFTVLVVLRGQLARAEFERGSPPKLARFDRGPNPAHASLAELVERMSLPGGDVRGPVWIVTDELFSRTLELEAGLVHGLDDEALAGALAYEAQLLSGLAASDAALGWRATGASRDPRTFWISQLARAELEQLTHELAERGAKLLGVVPAAGLPRRLTAPEADDGTTWRRVETWPELAVDVESSADGPVNVRVRPVANARARRETPSGLPVVESLSAGGLTAAPAPRELDLDKDEAALAEWISAWALVLAGGDAPAPVITPAERPVAPRTLVLAATCLALVAAGACWLHHAGEQSTLRELRAAALTTAQPAERVSSAQRERSTLDAQIAELERALQAAEASRSACAWSADAAARWMELLAELRPAGVRVEELDLGWRGSVARGLSADAAAVDALASALTKALAAQGCLSSANSKHWRARADGGGAYEFQIGIGGANAAPPPPRENDG